MKKFTVINKINENINDNIEINIADIENDNINIELDLNNIPVKQKEDSFNDNYNTNNLIPEICVIMCLLNNNFLDNILDGGNKNRYTQNTKQFVLDLKTLMLNNNNRLKFGKFSNSKCIEEDSIFAAKYFDLSTFTIEKDWNMLVNARNVARAISDKIINNGNGDKLTPEQIKYIFWCAPNSKDIKADIVIETTSGKQYPIRLNVNVTFSKTSSFKAFSSIFIGNDYTKLESDEYKTLLNILVKNWVRLIYENAKSPYQLMIDNFISADRINEITYDEYFNITHQDDSFKNLGEYFKELDTHYKYLYKLLIDIWKDRKNAFGKYDEIYFMWNKFKIQNLNSKILEHLFTNSINSNNMNNITNLNNVSYPNYVQANNDLKKNIIVYLLDRLDACETDIYFVSKNASVVNKIPSRQWFRENYDQLSIIFDYHTQLIIDNKDDENNNFKVNILVLYNDKEIIKSCSKILFSGGDISQKFVSKTNLSLPVIFNHI